MPIFTAIMEFVSQIVTLQSGFVTSILGTISNFVPNLVYLIESLF